MGHPSNPDVGRYTEIEKANRILLERMTNIMSVNQARSANNSTPQAMPPIVRKKSMNSDVRRRDLMKITIENQAILKRLQDKTSNYSVERWEDDFRETEKRMKNMCEYPLVFQSNPGYLKAKQLGLLDDGTRFQTASELLGVDSSLISRGGQSFPRAGTAVSANRRDISKSFNSLIPPSAPSGAGPSTEAKRVIIK